MKNPLLAIALSAALAVATARAGSNDSILLIGQIGWTPEFFKRSVPVESVATSDGKTNVGEKSVVAAESAKEIITHSELKGLPGHYWFGAYWSPWNFPPVLWQCLDTRWRLDRSIPPEEMKGSLSS
jgi:hypothetical protein